jgi:phosphoglycerol transferase MdoB-like AlkP superfamily enzyme
MMTSFTRYGRILGLLSAVYLVLSLLLRVFLWQQFGLAEGVTAEQLPAILGFGLINDVVEAVYMLLPVSVFLLLLPAFPPDSRRYRISLLGLSYIWLFSLNYIVAAEYFFFEEFESRFNLVAVDYLIYPHEVMINIWESYPVPLVLAANALISVVLLYFLAPYLLKQTGIATPRFWQRLAAVGGHGVLVAALGLTVSTYSLAFSQNRVANELTINGGSSFFLALHTNELDYDQFYRTGPQDQMFRLLQKELARSGGEFTRAAEGRLDRHFAANPQGLGKLNVVVLLEESFGAEFVGAYGDSRGLTPEFDRLSSQGVLFTRAYATGTRTVRGIEAVTASFPPIPSESIVKRPGNDHIANWGNVMRRQGYHTSFLYGGFGYFDNMNAFFEANDFATSDRNDIKDPHFSNIWGVSDEDLFRHAIGYFNQIHQQGQPFYSVVLSTSNHKPFTFPQGIPGVKPSGGGRDAGARYADYALGQFFKAAAEQPWYRDTLFIVVADHGARVYGKAEIPLYSYEIPLLFFAPGHLAPRHVDTLTSQVDIAPTALNLLGFEYNAPFFGRNVLAADSSQVPAHLLFNHNHDVALYREDGPIAVLGLQKSGHVYRYERANRSFTPQAADEDLLNLAAAYYQTAFSLFKKHQYE